MKVKIESRENCSFCYKAKDFLSMMEIEYEEVHQPTGKVPQIYFGEDHIGGFDDLLELSYDEEKWEYYFGDNN